MPKKHCCSLLKSLKGFGHFIITHLRPRYIKRAVACGNTSCLDPLVSRVVFVVDSRLRIVT